MTHGTYILRSCLFLPSNLIESSVGYEILAWKLFSVRTSKALFHYLLTSSIATKESDTILVLHVISSLSLSLRTFILYPQNSAISLISINTIVVSHLYSLCWAFVEPIQSENILQESCLYNFFDNSLVCFICSIFQKLDFLNWFSNFLFSLFVLFFWKS